MEDDSATEDFSPRLTPLQRFGADVRRVRLGRKLKQKQLGAAIGYSESYVSQVESGKLPPSTKFAVGCDRVFGTNGLFGGLLDRLTESDHPLNFTPYLALEPRASEILDWSTTVLMGLCQTEAYANAIFRAGHPSEPEEVIQGKTVSRMDRRRILDGARPPHLWVVLHEACLRTLVGGRSVMTAQLQHLLSLADRPGVDIQVMPFEAGADGAHSMAFTLLRFADLPAVLYSEDPRGGRLFDHPAGVSNAQRGYDRLRANALSTERSRSFVGAILKEYL
ncbi:helix-turn-helix transcriptional regulator [Streptomyces sp. P38-E01]|uniref:Helix-turn-helix transcriptional regulator n=1 Tax=Streptomyces tardus TaxID=2780544 RepID=A0A949JIM4_9ACTN|nr:helix-turn-helix transcriptional regulator [Streptomyces tardus]MBU7599325.1 helix-turn-helix transcriptional regulator [Streptomyces tardus]